MNTFSLTEFAALTKKGILIIAILAVVGLSGFISYQLWYNKVYLPNKPAVITPPDVRFGKLPKPNFPISQSSTSNFNYALSTKTGGLTEPDKPFPQPIKVYFIPQLGATLLAPDRAKSLAQSLNFNSAPEIITPTNYRFSDNQGGFININLDSGNFKYERPIATTSAGLANPFSNKDTIIAEFKRFLDEKGLLQEEIRAGKVSINSNSLQSTTSVPVSLWPSNIDDLPIVTPTFTQGLINATVTTFPDQNQRYPRLSYTFWKSDKSVVSTYPLKTVDQAFSDLKAGKGVVINKPINTNASITSVYLGYYQPENYTPFTYPVFVFEGENFASYVPAITDEYIEQ